VRLFVRRVSFAGFKTDPADCIRLLPIGGASSRYLSQTTNRKREKDKKDKSVRYNSARVDHVLMNRDNATLAVYDCANVAESARHRKPALSIRDILAGSQVETEEADERHSGSVKILTDSRYFRVSRSDGTAVFIAR